MNVETKVKGFIEFKKKMNKMLSEYCRANGICLKCHNPTKEVAKDSFSCKECLDKMKKISKERYRRLKEQEG